MEVRFHPSAVSELEEALDHYAAIDGKLALGLLREWDMALARIRQAPSAWQMVRNECRRYLLSRYPYAVIFRIKENVIEVIAFMHLKRKPAYWNGRSRS